MIAHTPGPWSFCEARGPREELCFHEVIDLENNTVCSTWAGPNEANARLIAAAPELLEALRGALSYLSLYGPSAQPALLSARAAIAKATGTQTS